MVTIESNIYNKTSDDDIILGANIIVYNNANNEVQKISIVDETELNKLKSELGVLDKTFVRFNDNSSLSGKSIDSLLSNSENNVVINATKLAGLTSDNFSKTGHTHDDRYFTESEVTAKLANKSDTSHSHDWKTLKLSSTMTLFVNESLRLCILKYSRTISSTTANNTTEASNIIPSNYKPKSFDVVGSMNYNAAIIASPDGNVTVRFFTSYTSQRVFKGTVVWNY